MERTNSSECAAALAGAVAGELADQLTVILNGLGPEHSGPEDRAAVERASVRCASVARGLMRYAHRYGGTRRPLPLHAVLDDDML